MGHKSYPTTFIFNSAGGSEVATQVGLYLKNFPTAPTKYGSSFNGWFIGETEITTPYIPQTTDNYVLELTASWNTLGLQYRV